MAFDPNYYGAGFNPYGQYQPQQRQTNTYAFVNGIEGAKSFIVPPNQTVLLMDSEQAVCYMKQSNGLGQGSLRYFKLVEVSESDIRSESLAKTSESVDFATKKDLQDLIERINKLESDKKDGKSV